MVDSMTGEVVQSHDKGRGYDVGEQQVLLVKDEELEAARQEARSRPITDAQTRTPAPTEETSVGIPADVGQREIPQRNWQRKDGRKREANEDHTPAHADAPPPMRRVVNNRTIEIEKCVPLEQIDEEDTHRFVTTYRKIYPPINVRNGSLADAG
jgi:hypothetical protein